MISTHTWHIAIIKTFTCFVSSTFKTRFTIKINLPARWRGVFLCLSKRYGFNPASSRLVAVSVAPYTDYKTVGYYLWMIIIPLSASPCYLFAYWNKLSKSQGTQNIPTRFTLGEFSNRAINRTWTVYQALVYFTISTLYRGEFTGWRSCLSVL